MRRIAIFQSDLGIGGIQKSLINLLNHIDLKENEVDLFLFDDGNFYGSQLPKSVNVHYRKRYPVLNKVMYFRVLKRICGLTEAGKAYDVAIDFNGYWNECAIGALTVRAKKRVMWIHNDVARKREEDLKYRLLWHFFKGKLSGFDEFAVVSSGIVDAFRKLSGIHDKKIHVIPNHIDTTEILEKSTEKIDFTVDQNCFNLVTMGRLTRQKGFDLLLDHMAEVIRVRKDIRLFIIGDGPERESLKRQIVEKDLSSSVTMLGSQPNPFPYLKAMDGFVLTSRYEGQGMVILEAKALGLQLFITKNLEKYNEDVPGSENIVQDLLAARKMEKRTDVLSAYNDRIAQRLNRLMET